MLTRIKNRFPLKTRLFILVPFVFLVTGCSREPSESVELPETVRDCTYTLEMNSRVKIKAPGYPQDGKEFVFIKRHAYIPAWKVWSGFGGGEMKEIGETVPHPDTPGNPDGYGKRVFVGLGHCNAEADPYRCFDPLPATMLFIVPAENREGAEPPDVIPGPGHEDEAGFWWDFNGYFDLSKLPADPTEEELPCWVKQCINGDVRRSTCPMPGTVAVTTAVTPPNFVVAKDIDVIDPPPPHWGEIENKNYLFDKVITGDPAGDPRNWAEEIGTYDASEVFSVWYGTIEGYLYLDQQTADDGNYYRYQEVTTGTGEAPTLQLDMFIPERNFRYEWWTPSCKPVIYLYPEESVNVSVKLKPFGIITESIPKYPVSSGWQNILAQPDGTLVYEAQEYESLYYEGRIINIKVPKEGFVLRESELADFFDWILPKLGLNEKERGDFVEYWLSRLNKKDKYYFVAIIPREEIDRVEPMEISQDVDTLIRVRFYFKELEAPIKVNTPRLNFSPPERNGFTVVDWGGFYKE